MGTSSRLTNSVVWSVTPRTRQQKTEDEACKALDDRAPHLLHVLKGGSTNHHLLCLQVLGDKRTSPYISRGERARYPAESVRKVYAMKETLHKIRNLSPHLRGPFGLSPVAPWNFPFRERASESLPLCPFWMHTGACVSKTAHGRRGRVGSCVAIKSKPPSMLLEYTDTASC